MCEKCPIDQRYPYYGFPVTPDSRKLRDEAERYREIAIRCFVAESDCADVKRADALTHSRLSGVSLSITPVLALSGAINPFYTIEVF